jgi:hypothetical protein
MAQRMAELGVPWVRICVVWTFWSDPAFGNEYKNLIDSYVNEFTSRGVYCMVGCMGGEFASDVPSNPTPWLNFLTELANRYRSNPGMCGIYIWNEPPTSGPFTMSTWRQWALLGVQAVNAVNPNLLIVVSADLPYASGILWGIDPYYLSNPIPYPNIVYYYHDYFWHYYYYYKTDPGAAFVLTYQAGNYTLAKQQMEKSFYDRYWKYPVEHNMCIMNEEFGFGANLDPTDRGYEPGWPQCQIDYMDLHEKYQIPWNQYDWWVGGYALTTDGFNLHPVGQIWSQYLGPP